MSHKRQPWNGDRRLKVELNKWQTVHTMHKINSQWTNYKILQYVIRIYNFIFVMSKIDQYITSGVKLMTYRSQADAITNRATCTLLHVNTELWIISKYAKLELNLSFILKCVKNQVLFLFNFLYFPVPFKKMGHYL